MQHVAGLSVELQGVERFEDPHKHTSDRDEFHYGCSVEVEEPMNDDPQPLLLLVILNRIKNGKVAVGKALVPGNGLEELEYLSWLLKRLVTIWRDRSS